MARDMTVEEQIISTIQRDDHFLEEAILSISKVIKRKSEEGSPSDIIEAHERLGEILSKYVQTSVKNTGQLIQLYSTNANKVKKGLKETDEKPTEDDVEDVFDSLEDQKSGKK